MLNPDPDSMNLDPKHCPEANAPIENNRSRRRHLMNISAFKVTLPN